MFYAVKVGRKPGIYKTWAEAEAQVKKYSGAVYQKFTTEAAALSFLQGTPDSKPVTTSQEFKSTGYQLWMDGSAKLGSSASYAWAIVKDDVMIREGGGKVALPPFSAPQAEAVAAIEGVRAMYLYSLETKGQPIACDAYGDNKFVIDTINVWGPQRSAKDWEGKEYAVELQDLLRFLSEYRTYAPFNFHKVPSHTGIKWNDYVDQLAERYRNS